MKILKLQNLLMLLLLLVVGASSCNNEENLTSTIPSELIRTWYLNEETYVTFNRDGTGVYVESDNTRMMKFTDEVNPKIKKTTSFTYSYEEDGRELIIRMNGEIKQWKIVLLTKDTLKVKDENGQLQEFSTQPNANWADLLYGKWGFAGKTMMEFSNINGENLFTLYEGEEFPYSVKFKCEGNRRIYFYEDEIWGDDYWYVETVTKDILTVEQYEEGIYSTYTLFRIPEPDELVVGDESLLYGEEWTSFDTDGVVITLQFNKDPQTVVWTEEGENMSVHFIYDPTFHKLTLTTDDGEKIQYRIIKLTDHIMYMEELENGVVVDYLELRRL